MQSSNALRFIVHCTALFILLVTVITEGLAEKSGSPPTGIEFNNGDRVVILGGTLAERMQHDAWVETLIQNRATGKKLSFRKII